MAATTPCATHAPTSPSPLLLSSFSFVCCSEYAADGKAVVEMVRSRLHTSPPPGPRAAVEAKAGHGHDHHGSGTGTGTGTFTVGGVAGTEGQGQGGAPVAAFDCVLLDRALPLVNGLLTAKALREQVIARAALLHLASNHFN